jgi:hypothetical protein
VGFRLRRWLLGTRRRGLKHSILWTEHPLTPLILSSFNRWVLSKYGKKLDDVEEALEAHR